MMPITITKPAEKLVRPLSVRPVQMKDRAKLFDLLMMAHEENAPYTVNTAKVMNIIDRAIDGDPIIVGVIESEDGLAGTIGAGFSQWWYTDDWHIEECWNFVHPDHRRSAHAKELIDYMKWISENINMPLHMGILTAERMEPKIRLYRRQMFQVGASFVYNIAAAHGPIAGIIGHG